MGKKFINQYNINLKSLSEKDDFSFDFSNELFLYYDKENDLKTPNGTCKTRRTESNIQKLKPPSLFL